MDTSTCCDALITPKGLCARCGQQTEPNDGRAARHEQRIVGHVSGWQEHMPTCVCGKPWPCNGDLVARIIRNVCELPDYTSPDDQPDLLTCTVDELELCIRRALGEEV